MSEFHQWVSTFHPEWWAEAANLGGVGYHKEYKAACAAWDAAIDTVLDELAEVEISDPEWRAVNSRITKLLLPPAMAEAK